MHHLVEPYSWPKDKRWKLVFMPKQNKCKCQHATRMSKLPWSTKNVMLSFQQPSGSLNPSTASPASFVLKWRRAA